MAAPTVVHRARRVDPPAGALAYLTDVDYADAFAIASAPPTPARTWAKLCLTGGPSLPRRAFSTLVWHGVLGFDLAASQAPDTFAGWSIVVDEPELFVLTCEGRLMSGLMVFAAPEAGVPAVTWTTALHYLSPRAKTIWSAAQHVHHALAPRLLTGAASRLAT
ncbi:MAG TPA: hypothetical protein VJ831_08610 [Jatrophihabitantaceae bacterium]|nr:hypothetical protein [Jatrophihabitantaceae bacterium]